jgi:RNA polymerase sigma-70 factor (ECF subfamily)
VIGRDFARLLAAAKRGDEAAFALLWRDANPALLRYLRVVAGDEPDDVASETWATVARGLRRFRGDEQAWRAWLFTTARRRAVDDGRRRGRLRDIPVAELPDTAGLTTSSPRDPADAAIGAWTLNAAIAAVRRLPPQQAEIVMLRNVAGLSVEEVARLVGSTPGAVRVAAHRGLRKLARELADEGVTP